MIIKFLMPVLMLAAASGMVRGQDILFSGTVTNAITKNVITGVEVRLKGTDTMAVTGTDGAFTVYEDGSAVYDRPVPAAGSAGAYSAAGRYDLTGRRMGTARVGYNGIYLLTGPEGIRRQVVIAGQPVLSGRPVPAAGKQSALVELVFSREGYATRETTVTAGSDSISLYLEKEWEGAFFSDFTDHTVRRNEWPVVDNENWQISTYCCGTGSNWFQLENCAFSDTAAGDTGTGYLHMTVRADTLKGAEIWSTRKFHYGFYETRMKCSDVPGCVNAYFLHDWNNGHIGEEVDLEFLTSDFAGTPGSGIVRCMLHPGNSGGARTLPFNPSEGFHRYGWIWKADTLKWLADGAVIQTVTDTSVIPDGYVQMVYNNWTGSANWGGGPPSEDNTMIIDWCRYYPGADTIVPFSER